MKKKIGLTIIAGGLFLNGLPVSANELQELVKEDIVEEVKIEETTSEVEEVENEETVLSEDVVETNNDLQVETKVEKSGIQTRGLGDGRFNLDDWQYVKLGGRIELQQYIGNDVDIVIPEFTDYPNEPLPQLLYFADLSMLNNIPNIETIKFEGTLGPVVTNLNFDNAFDGNQTLKHLDIGKIGGGSVNSLNSAFANMPNLESVNISGWDLNSITTIDSVFKNSPKLKTITASNVKTNSLTQFTNSFDGVNAETLDITGWNLENVTDTANILLNSNITTVIANDVVLNQATNIKSFMHQAYTPGVEKTLLLNNANLGNRTNLTEMFLNTSYHNIELGGWNTSGITSMSYMFRLAEHLGDLDLSHFDMTNVNSVTAMFQQAVMGDLNIDDWELNSIGTIGGFSGLLSSGKFRNIDMSNWKIKNNMSLGSTFMLATISEKVTFKNLDITPGTTINDGFYQLNAKELDVSGWTNTDRFTSLGSLFANAKNLEYVDLSGWDVSNVTNTKWIFSATSLGFVDISGWDLSNVTIEFEDVFAGNNTGMDASRVQVPAGTSKYRMFTKMRYLDKLVYNDFVALPSDNLIGMFEGLTVTELELNNWDVTQVDSIGRMFSLMPNIEKLDLTGMDVSGVRLMMDVFKGSKKLKEVDTTGWDTSSVEYMMGMFYGCESLEEIDLSHFDTSSLEHAGQMFKDTKELRKIDLSGWNTSLLESTWAMFEGADKLTMIDLTGWDTSNISPLGVNDTFKTANPTPLTVFATDTFFTAYDYAGDNRTPEFLGLQKNAHAGRFSDGTAKQELTYKVNDFVMNQRMIAEADYNAFTAEEPTPTTAGDYFTGWDNTNLNVTQDYDLFDGSQIFNANYRNTYPVVFHDIAGDINLVGTYGTVLTGVPSPTVKPNHGFVEWNTQADGLGTSFDPTSDTVPGALELYPIYKLNEYSVKVNINGVITTIHVNHGGLIDVNDLPQIVDKEGYTFVGWNTQADGLGLNFNPLSDPVTADLEIYPIYKINVYKIEINIDGVITTINANYGTKLKEADLPVPPKKEGYTFVGWQVLSGRSVDMFDFDNDVIKSNLVLAPYYTKDKDPVTPPVTPPVKPTDPTKPTESKGGVNTGIEMNAHSTMITLLTSLGLVGLVAVLQKKRQKQEK